MLVGLTQAMTKLSDAERKIVQLIFFEEKSERTAAEMLGIPQKTLNDRKLRVLTKLRKIMDSEK